MRFRYIDSKGREITLDSVEALAARIDLGAVGADTELFDASTESWGRADGHEIFRKLLAEAAAADFVAATPAAVPGPAGTEASLERHETPREAPVPALEVEPTPSADAAPTSDGVATGDATPGADAAPAADASDFSLEASQGFEGLTVAANVEETVRDALHDATAHALSDSPNSIGDEADEVPAEGEVAGDSHDLNIGGALEVEGGDASSFNEVAASREPPLDGFSASPGLVANDAWAPEPAPAPASDGPQPPPEDESFGGELEFDTPWGSSDDEPHPFDAPQDISGAPNENGGWPAEALLEDENVVVRASNPLVGMLSAPVVQWGFLAAAFMVMAVFGSSVGSGFLLRALLTVGGVSFVGLATGFLLWSDPERRTLIPAATFGLIALISVPLFLVGSKAQAASPPLESVVSDRVATSRPSGPVLAANPGEMAMEGRAIEEMVHGMDSLAVTYGLDRRPADWLHGVYLANASRYPAVEEYWHRYTEYVAEVRAQDGEWFRTSYTARLRAAGIQPAAIEGLVERGATRFEASRASREGLYDRMDELAASALELHALLLEREDDIDWEPFEQTGVSEAPVVEAVPNDPELEDRMWALIAKVALSLESISNVGETSPAHLQNALVDSIRASVGR